MVQRQIHRSLAQNLRRRRVAKEDVPRKRKDLILVWFRFILKSKANETGALLACVLVDQAFLVGQAEQLLEFRLRLVRPGRRGHRSNGRLAAGRRLLLGAERPDFAVGEVRHVFVRLDFEQHPEEIGGQPVPPGQDVLARECFRNDWGEIFNINLIGISVV